MADKRVGPSRVAELCGIDPVTVRRWVTQGSVVPSGFRAFAGKQSPYWTAEAAGAVISEWQTFEHLHIKFRGHRPGGWRRDPVTKQRRHSD
jgi:hypothetical protein